MFGIFFHFFIIGVNYLRAEYLLSIKKLSTVQNMIKVYLYILQVLILGLFPKQLGRLILEWRNRPYQSAHCIPVLTCYHTFRMKRGVHVFTNVSIPVA